MNLGKQIDSLLRRQAAVYVKGLGVFRRIHTSATFDSKSNVFLPPISYLEFEYLSTDGYDFISYLQQITPLERADAERELDSAVAAVVDDISKTGEATLDNLGTLVSFGDAYVFKPLDLSGFQYVPVENDYPISEVEEEAELESNIDEEEVLEEIVEIKVEEPQKVTAPAKESVFGLEARVVEQREAVEPVVEGNLEEEQFSNEKSNSYIYGLVAAVAFLLLGGAYYYFTIYQAEDYAAENYSFANPAIDSSVNQLDTTNVLVDSLADTIAIVQDTVEVIAEPIAVAPKEQKIVDHKYIIVIGTNATLEQANTEAAAYNKKGHKSVRVLTPNMSKNKKRVIWDTYPTREKRDSALREVRKNIKPDAWGAEI